MVTQYIEEYDLNDGKVTETTFYVSEKGQKKKHKVVHFLIRGWEDDTTPDGAEMRIVQVLALSIR